MSNQPSWHRWGGEGQQYKGQVVYNAIKYYGWENVKHEIYDWNLSQSCAEAIERKLIKDLKSTVKENGYNVALGGNHRGKCSEETKRKRALKAIGRKMTPQAIQNMMYAQNHRNKEWEEKRIEAIPKKAVIQINLQNKILNEFISASEAGRSLKIRTTSICRVCRKERKTYKGYIWRYKDENSKRTIK